MKRPGQKRPRPSFAKTSPRRPSTPPQPPATPLRSKYLSGSKIQSKELDRVIFKPLSDSCDWAPLNLAQSELSLPLTFPTGQTFRWKQTGYLQFTGAIGPHLVSLRHGQDGDIYYRIHRTHSQSAAYADLLDFLNVSISLNEMWKGFATSDTRFYQLSRCLAGARVLRQNPLECLFQFICSSNNNISRITKMVDFLSSLGDHLGSFERFEFYRFPSLEQLGMITDQQLRKAGLGYRAKYILGTVEALKSKDGGGEEWLSSLRRLDLKSVLSALCTLPGVGPKVAACVALFSLDQHHAVPVDTHVWQIATKYFLPELAGTRLTPKLHGRVADAFLTQYGKFAGWAQTLYFVSELPALQNNPLSLA